MNAPQKWSNPHGGDATVADEAQQAPPANSAPKPQLQQESATKGLEMLLRIEAEARRASTVSELSFLIANETQKMARSRQIFVLTGSNPARFKVSAISAVSQFDKKSALVEWVEDIAANLVREFGGSTSEQFMLPELTNPDNNFHQTYPFSFMLWVPLRLRDNTLFGGILLARESPWTPADNIVADRLADTYAHSWSALVGAKALKKKKKTWPAYAAGASVAVLAAGFFPVPMSVLAPMEVAAVDTKVIAAPIDGIVEGLLVEPNATVKAGDPIIQMSDTALRNEHAVAQEELTVSQAKLKQVMQAAVTDPKMLREIAIARAEVDVKKAQLAFSSDMLTRSRVTAPVDGVAVYTDRREWMGKPVQTGERIMDLVDPTHLELRIFLPVQDSIALNSGMTVRAFLDSDPLHPRDAVVRTASYEARPHQAGVLSYEVVADFVNPDAGELRLGTLGTAQISGKHVPLAFLLLRRPISALRQWAGL